MAIDLKSNVSVLLSFDAFSCSIISTQLWLQLKMTLATVSNEIPINGYGFSSVNRCNAETNLRSSCDGRRFKLSIMLLV